jgi:hypothetical protein
MFWFIFVHVRGWISPSCFCLSNQNIKFRNLLSQWKERKRKKMENSSIRKLKILYSHYCAFSSSIWKKKCEWNWKVWDTQHTVRKLMWENSSGFLVFHCAPFFHGVCVYVCNKSKSCDKRKLQPDPREEEKEIAKFKVSFLVKRIFCERLMHKIYFPTFFPSPHTPVRSLFFLSIWCAFNAAYDLKVFRFAIWSFTFEKKLKCGIEGMKPKKFLKNLFMFGFSWNLFENMKNWLNCRI